MPRISCQLSARSMRYKWEKRAATYVNKMKMLQGELDLKNPKVSLIRFNQISFQLNVTGHILKAQIIHQRCEKMKSLFHHSKTLLQMLTVTRIQQQCFVQTMQMSKCEFMKFVGDPLKYWQFIRTFKNTINKKGTVSRTKT